MSDDNPLMCCCCRAAHQHIIEEKDAETERLRLTKEEREALEFVAGWLEDGAVPDTINHSRYAAIRGMLERFGSVE